MLIVCIFEGADFDVAGAGAVVVVLELDAGGRAEPDADFVANERKKY